MKQTAVLGSPVYIRQAQGKNLKRGAKVRPGPLSSLRIFWVSMPSDLEDVFSFIFEIKLSCNTGPSLPIFVVMRQNRGDYALP